MPVCSPNPKQSTKKKSDGKNRQSEQWQELEFRGLFDDGGSVTFSLIWFFVKVSLFYCLVMLWNTNDIGENNTLKGSPLSTINDK